jgi:hypothetical protein
LTPIKKILHSERTAKPYKSYVPEHDLLLPPSLRDWLPVRGLAKHEGAGLYLEVSAKHVLMAGGLYAPQPPELHRLREHLAANHRRFRALVESPSFTRALEGLRARS